MSHSQRSSYLVSVRIAGSDETRQTASVMVLFPGKVGRTLRRVLFESEKITTQTKLSEENRCKQNMLDAGSQVFRTHLFSFPGGVTCH